MIKKEEKVFFALLRAGLWGKADGNHNVNLNEKIDWNDVYQLAKEQSVQGLTLQGIEVLRNHYVNHNDNANDGMIISPQIKLDIPQVLLLQWIGEVQVIEQRNKAMNGFIVSLMERMRDAAIYTLLVKGQGVAQCYERPLWRACGDVDLFLNDDNYNKAKQLLIPLASEVEKESIVAKHLGMTINGWIVELHGTLFVGMPNKINRVLNDIQRDTFYGGNVRSWINQGTHFFLLGKENDALYVFIHFLNHFYKGGIGLRQICDWCRLLWTFRESLDLQKLESQIKRAGLMSEWKAFGAFAVEYLGMPVDAVPLLDARSLKENGRLKRKAERIKDFILMSGNFGHNRDMSYYSKYPYIIRKCFSMGRRVGDLCRHARIFPLDSLRFSGSIMFNGLRAAMRGE